MRTRSAERSSPDTRSEVESGARPQAQRRLMTPSQPRPSERSKGPLLSRRRCARAQPLGSSCRPGRDAQLRRQRPRASPSPGSGSRTRRRRPPVLPDPPISAIPTTGRGRPEPADSPQSASSPREATLDRRGPTSCLTTTGSSTPATLIDLATATARLQRSTGPAARRFLSTVGDHVTPAAPTIALTSRGRASRAIAWPRMRSRRPGRRDDRARGANGRLSTRRQSAHVLGVEGCSSRARGPRGVGCARCRSGMPSASRSRAARRYP